MLSCLCVLDNVAAGAAGYCVVSGDRHTREMSFSRLAGNFTSLDAVTPRGAG